MSEMMRRKFEPVTKWKKRGVGEILQQWPSVLLFMFFVEHCVEMFLLQNSPKFQSYFFEPETRVSKGDCSDRCRCSDPRKQCFREIMAIKCRPYLETMVGNKPFMKGSVFMHFPCLLIAMVFTHLIWVFFCSWGEDLWVVRGVTRIQCPWQPQLYSWNLFMWSLQIMATCLLAFCSFYATVNDSTQCLQLQCDHECMQKSFGVATRITSLWRDVIKTSS